MTERKDGARSETTEVVLGREAAGVRIGNVVECDHGYGRVVEELEHEKRTGDRSVRLELLPITGDPIGFLDRVMDHVEDDDAALKVCEMTRTKLTGR